MVAQARISILAAEATELEKRRRCVAGRMDRMAAVCGAMRAVAAAACFVGTQKADSYIYPVATKFTSPNNRHLLRWAFPPRPCR